MDRLTNYYGALAREVDLLLTNQNAMIAIGEVAQAVFGTPTLVADFTCVPTSPASLNVVVTPGQVYSAAPLEATAWSSLLADTGRTILKQGIVLDNSTFGITPPVGVGQSQVFLVQVQYQDLDTSPVTLPYYNAANPIEPFLGPGNSGVSQNTIRKGLAAVQVKAGVAATTGSQTTPSADAGWTGLFAITVANGATTITAGNITTLATAPFLATFGKLPQIPTGVLANSWRYGTVGGTANAITLTLSPVPDAYRIGMEVHLTPAANSTGAATINVNGLGVKSIVRSDGSALLPLDLQLNAVAVLQYAPTGAFQLLNPAAGVPRTFINRTVIDGPTSGTFVAPVTGVYRISLWGGAAGGGAGLGSGGGGGGGGATCLEDYVYLIAGTGYAYVIGGAGTGGGAGTSNPGTAGVTSTFSGPAGTLISSAGSPGAGAAIGAAGTGGAAGSFSGQSANGFATIGEAGYQGNNLASPGGGKGGSAGKGGSGGAPANSNGNSGTAPGGGGGGGSQGGSGGAGAAGRIIFEW
jgi:hypothetical protein